MWTSFSIACRAASRRRREQRADVDVEAEIGEGRGDHLLAAVVAVLAHLGDEDARPAPVVALERLDERAAPARSPRTSPDLPLVDARDRLDLGAMAAPHLLQRRRDLADRRLRPRRLDARARAGCRRPSPRRATVRSSAAVTAGLVALGAQAAQLVDLQRAHALNCRPSALRSARRRPARNLLTPTTVCAPASMRAWVRAAASSMRSFGMPASIAFAMPPSASTSWMCAQAFARKLVGQPLDVVGAAPRIDDARRAALLLQEELGVARDAGGEIGRQRQRLVERVGVQRLRAALASPPSPRSSVRATLLKTSCAVSDQPEVWQWVRKRQRLIALRREALDELRPQQARRRAASPPP